jgi:hypothetical protein
MPRAPFVSIVQVVLAAVLTTGSGLLLGACGRGGVRLPATDGVRGRDQVERGDALGTMRLKRGVCDGVDVSPDYATLDEQSIVGFLKARGFPLRTVRARSDLVYVEVQLNPDRDEWVRLRVAMLPSAAQAGQELHEAVLQHGAGTWGVHRANLAVLAPPGTPEDVVAFAVRTKLACWGVLTVAGRDDTFVIAGGYREL